VSRDLSVVNRNVLAAKLADLSDRLDRLKGHRPSSAEELGGDRDALDLVSFNLMLAIQICADISSHLIADEGWPAARNLGESFTRLQEHGVIDAALASELRRAVGLRNVVAHGYAGVDVAAVFAGATGGVADLESFARQVAGWLGRRP
jgi:uncharacterized protein YutE (UPF0331/DUF86 family)